MYAMSPAELLADHQRTPRNIGKLLNANATGDVGSIVVGDALRFYIQIADERVTAAKFQVFNAGEQVATASALTELVVGRSLDEAHALLPADVCRHLGGLAFDQLPVRVWAIDALRAALDSYRGEEPDAHEEDEALLCRCHGISEATVLESIRVMDLGEVDAVVNATGAGSGCGSCRSDIPRLIDTVRNTPATPAPAPTATGAGPKGRIATVHRIMNLYEARLASTLRDQGGGLELMDLDGGFVVVRGEGTLVSNDEALRQALATLERLLKDEIDHTLGVRLSQ